MKGMKESNRKARSPRLPSGALWSPIWAQHSGARHSEPRDQAMQTEAVEMLCLPSPHTHIATGFPQPDHCSDMRTAVTSGQGHWTWSQKTSFPALLLPLASEGPLADLPEFQLPPLSLGLISPPRELWGLDGVSVEWRPSRNPSRELCGVSEFRKVASAAQHGSK